MLLLPFALGAVALELFNRTVASNSDRSTGTLTEEQQAAKIATLETQVSNQAAENTELNDQLVDIESLNEAAAVYRIIIDALKEDIQILTDAIDTNPVDPDEAELLRLALLNRESQITLLLAANLEVVDDLAVAQAALSAQLASGYSGNKFLRNSSVAHVTGKGGLYRHAFGYLSAEGFNLSAAQTSEFRLVAHRGRVDKEEDLISLTNYVPNNEMSSSNVAEPDGSIIDLSPVDIGTSMGNARSCEAIFLSHQHRVRQHVNPVDRPEFGYLLEFEDGGQLENLRDSLLLTGIQRYHDTERLNNYYYKPAYSVAQWLRKNVLYVQAVERESVGWGYWYPAIIVHTTSDVAVRLKSISLVKAQVAMIGTHTYSSADATLARRDRIKGSAL